MERDVDPGLAVLVRDPRFALRPPAPNQTVSALRAAANAFLARAVGPVVADITDMEAHGYGVSVPLRLYRPCVDVELPVILFVHGGGFVLGDLGTHDALCRSFARQSGAAVLAVEYRLAPEHPCPCALEDIATAFAWIDANAELAQLDRLRVALVGDSAGGQLALVSALRFPALRHLALIYPMLDPARGSGSAADYNEGYMLTGAFLDWAWHCYRGSMGPEDERLDPAAADLRHLPPTTIVTAEFDPLRDEGQAFARRLAAAGNPVTHRCYPGMIHGFAGLPHMTPVADEAIGYVAARLAASLAP